MRNLLFVYLLAVFGMGCYSLKSIKAEYGKLFTVISQTSVDSTDTTTHYDIKVNSLSADQPLSGFVNHNKDIIYYFYTFYSRIKKDSLGKYKADSTLQNQYVSWELRHDNRFNKYFLRYVASYLQSKQDTLCGYDLVKKDTVSFKYVKSVAVRFFYPYKLVKKTIIKSHILTSTAGLKTMSAPRRPLVEAFAFAALVNHLKSSGLLKDYRKYVKESGKLGFSGSKEEKREKFQATVWGRLFKNPKMNEILISTYDKEHSYLPFVMVEAKPNS